MVRFLPIPIESGCGQRGKSVAINQQRDQLREAFQGISLAIGEAGHPKEETCGEICVLYIVCRVYSILYGVYVV